ncbi:glycoside hydrolase family 18 protein [Gelatoporia subvermispora B]|uniref:Glycoside hydrolase family 18 protein n=1 Tax=Ceriporiopsis subvermispora (strain B) TaxID=914234 RepID=M2QS27_CERS8|nr:glycoside hydrolase family 18 protein [Gelatoporia subvermispora B]
MHRTRMTNAAKASPIAAAYYPDWVSSSIPPQSLDFSKFDVLFFAFATPDASSNLSWDGGATDTLKTLVHSAHSSGHGTQVVLSIGMCFPLPRGGGWGGSHWFSQAMNSSQRSKFVGTCVNAVKTYNLDGIDIDWEYPGQQGDNNPFSPSDSENLLAFFSSLRSELGPSKIISAAVTDLPWTGASGAPLPDVSAYAKHMSFVNIMNYDVYQASPTPGPNAPLGNATGTARAPQFSAQAALTQWTKAGFPKAQLMLGLPLYGYVSQSTRTTLEDFALPPRTVRAEQKRQVLDVSIADQSAVERLVNGDVVQEKTLKNDAARTASGDLSAQFGQAIPFKQLVTLGALKKTSKGAYEPINGYTKGWDKGSDTPFLYDTARHTVVTYDDPQSLGDKAKFAKQQGMAGCFTWSLDQDDGYTLQDAIRSGLGK